MLWDIYIYINIWRNLLNVIFLTWNMLPFDIAGTLTAAHHDILARMHHNHYTSLPLTSYSILASRLRSECTSAETLCNHLIEPLSLGLSTFPWRIIYMRVMYVFIYIYTSNYIYTVTYNYIYLRLWWIYLSISICPATYRCIHSLYVKLSLHISNIHQNWQNPVLESGNFGASIYRAKLPKQKPTPASSQLSWWNQINMKWIDMVW